MLIIALFASLIGAFSQSQSTAEKVWPAGFIREEVMLPMRDGVRLQTAIFSPRHASGPLPILFTRTPYGVPPDDKDLTASGGVFEELVADGYIFVWQNLRGRFKSEGEFVMNRAPRDRKDARSIDETTDAWDSVDWLIKNVPNNNRSSGDLGNLIQRLDNGNGAD